MEVKQLEVSYPRYMRGYEAAGGEYSVNVKQL